MAARRRRSRFNRFGLGLLVMCLVVLATAQTRDGSNGPPDGTKPEGTGRPCLPQGFGDPKTVSAVDLAAGIEPEPSTTFMSPLDHIRHDLISALPCAFTGLEVIGGDESNLVVHLAPLGDEERSAVEEVAAQHTDVKLTAVEAKASFAAADAQTKAISDLMSAGGPEGQVTTGGMDLDGQVSVLAEGVPANDRANLAGRIASAAEAAGVHAPPPLVTVTSAPSQFKPVTLEYEINPDRAGQFRGVFQSGSGNTGGNSCTAGAQWHNGYGNFGSVAGHCGPVGWVVKGELGATTYISNLAQSSGFHNGTNYSVNADVASYSYAPTYGDLIEAPNNGLFRVRYQGGYPPVTGLSYCFSGHSSGTVCNVHMTMYNQFQTDCTNGCVTVNHMILIDHGAIGGDSGGPLFTYTGDKTTLYGTATIGGSNNTSYWTNTVDSGIVLNSSMIVCGC